MLARVLPDVRDIDVIDSELRLIAAVRAACREAGMGTPDVAVADELLDERARVTDRVPD